MSIPYSPERGGFAGTFGGPDLRVSDAERAEVADELSRHFGDGRLDQEEFNERLDRAMTAKTRSDLAGLFAGLPGPEPVPAALPLQARPRSPLPAQPRHRLLFVILVIVLASIVGQALVVPHIPWLLIALVAVLWVRHRRHHRL